MALATNPLEPFIWGAGGTRKTPEEIARDREIAAALLAQGVDTSPIGHWSQGAARVVGALGGVLKERRANKASETNAKESQSRIAALLGGLGGGSDPTSQFPPAPTSGQPAAAPMDYASSRVSQAFGDAPGGDIRTGIIATAQSLGIDPVDLATAISYETAGTFDPTKAGPTTQWGQHKGLIQFGEPQAQQYGVDWNDPLGSQLGPDGAVAKYLKDTGVQPGMGLLDIYSAINAGGVGRYDRSDANNGGAPGTVADKVNSQMAEHRQKAMALLGAQATAGPQGAPPPPGGIPGQQTMPMGQQAPGGVPMPEMAGNVQRPVQVAQSGGLNPAIIEALSSPYASAQERSIASILLEQEMQKNDPMRALQMQKLQQELTAKPERKTTTINGRLVDAQTGEEIANFPEAPKAPDMETLYDEKTGQEYKARWNPQTGEYERVGGLKAPSGMAVRMTPDGGFEMVSGGAKLTENQSKLTLFQSLQTETQPVLLDLEKQFDPANMTDAAARSTPIAGNFFKSEQGQIYESAATAWAEGALRIATGAAATPEEMERTKKAYFAQPGDTPTTISFKAQMREMYNRSINRALGKEELGGLPNPSEFAKKFDDEPGSAKKGKAVIDGYTIEQVD